MWYWHSVQDHSFRTLNEERSEKEREIRQLIAFFLLMLERKGKRATFAKL